MVVLLLIVIYIAFIGLGIPDSLFGTAWPSIYREFQLPLSYASYVTFLISLGTVISSFFSARWICRFGTAKITAFSTLLTALALLGFRFAPGFWCMCLLALPLGIGAGAIDTALNNYVALHYRASHMNFLHCFYGLGIICSPYLMSLALGKTNNWRNGYQSVVILQFIIALIMFLALPLWKKVNAKEESQESESDAVGFGTLLKQHRVRISCLIFMASCSIEFTCGIWGNTYLVEQKGLAVNEAAGLITFYYIGIAVGRFLAGLLSSRLARRQIITWGQCIVAIAVIVLLLPLHPYVVGAALFLVGLGNGPLFPNLLHLTPTYFGKKLSSSVMSIQMAYSYTGIMLAPFIFGLLAQNISVSVFPIYLAIWVILMFVATFAFRKQTAKIMSNPDREEYL